MRYQGSERLLANPRLEVDAVMARYARELLGRAAASGQRLVLILDQTRATAHQQVLMLGLRVGGRAPPLAWRGPGGPRAARPLPAGEGGGGGGAGGRRSGAGGGLVRARASLSP